MGNGKKKGKRQVKEHEKSTEFSQKTKNATVFWPSDSTVGNIPEESWNTNSKEFMHPYVHSSAIYNIQDLESA